VVVRGQEAVGGCLLEVREFIQRKADAVVVGSNCKGGQPPGRPAHNA